MSPVWLVRVHRGIPLKGTGNETCPRGLGGTDIFRNSAGRHESRAACRSGPSMDRKPTLLMAEARSERPCTLRDGFLDDWRVRS